MHSRAWPNGRRGAAREATGVVLAAALARVASPAEALGASAAEARLLMVDTFAHAAGLPPLAHTGRIRMFGAGAPELMARYIDDRIRLFVGATTHAHD